MTFSSAFRLPIGVLILLLLLAVVPAQSASTGGVILRWTAPGDDGYVGTAAGYQIRYQNFAQGPLDTEAEWNAAAQIPGVPFPSPAGSVDSVLVLGLTPGAGYYFALRSHDKAGNISELSNSPLIVAVATSCCIGRVGNANGSPGDDPTVSDIMTLVDHLMVSNRPLWCAAEGDINQSGGANPRQGPGGDITIADISMLIDYLFVSGRPLPQCF